MGKFTKLLIMALIAAALLFSCDRGGAEPLSTFEATQSSSALTESETETEFIPLTKEELREFYNNATQVYLYFSGYSTIKLGDETTEIDGKKYQLVTQPGLSSCSDLEALCHKYFDDTITASLMNKKIGGSSLFADYNGALYEFEGYAALLSYEGTGNAKFELITSSGDFATFSITDSVEVYGTPVSASYVYVVEYTGGKPLFTDYMPIQQQLADAFYKASEENRFVITEYDEGMKFRDLANPDIEWVPLASYGQNAADYSFSVFDDELKSYAVCFWPGVDGERYVTLGMRPNSVKLDEFSEFLTYHIVVKDRKIISVTKTDTYTSADILQSGAPYSNSLNGTYICKDYISKNNFYIYSISLFGDTYFGGASIDGTDATVSFNGTYSYDTATGAFSAKYQKFMYDDSAKKLTGSGNISGKLLYYNGFLHFVCEKSYGGIFSAESIMPLTFTLLNEQEAVASYRPTEAISLLFCHKVFTTDTYLLSYVTWPNTVCVYYTSNGGDSFTKLSIAIPAGIKYDTAEAVSSADDGGSGEACFYVALTTGTEVKYLRYDNFAATDETNLLTFTTDGKYIAKEDIPGVT
jgi:hypothetical protein